MMRIGISIIMVITGERVEVLQKQLKTKYWLLQSHS